MGPKYPDFVEVGPQSPSGRFLRRFWQPVYVSDRLKSGRAVALRMFDEDFTLFRGESGKVALIAARCAHRGARLSVGRVCADTISCIYHGWTYDAQGQCTAQPAEKRSFAASVRIASHPARDYHGLIFAYLGGGDPPPFPHIDTLDQEGLVEAWESRRSYPFFNQLENSVDEAHFNFTHRTSDFTDAGLNDEIPELSAEETEYGIARYARRGNAVRVAHILMPNCMYSSVYGHIKGWTDHFAWRVPIDRETHCSFGINLIRKTGAEVDEYRRASAREKTAMKDLEPAGRVVARIMSGEMHLDEVPPDRPDILNIQDTVAMMAQGPDVDRERDLLGASDMQVRMLRQIWTREIRAMEEGGPMKQWSVPPGLSVTRGVDA